VTVTAWLMVPSIPARIRWRAFLCSSLLLESVWRADGVLQPCPGDRLIGVRSGTEAARGPGCTARRDAANAAELLVLRHENAVLRRQLTGPMRYQSADRLWLAALLLPICSPS
jgi:hypothetical protein